MINLRSAIYDCITILSKGKYTDDSRLEDNANGFLAFKIHEKREQEIQLEYDKTKTIDPVWLQDYGVVDTTKVNTTDNINAALCKCSLGKITLPRVVSLKNNQSQNPDLGVYSILSVCGTNEFYYKSMTQLSYYTDDVVRSNFKYYSRIMDAVYVKPYTSQIRPLLILQNPLDGFMNDTENKTTLIIGTNYTVYDYQIVHNTLGYAPGDSFTAVATTFTGKGHVRLTNPQRQMTDLDPYPISSKMLDRIVTRILTEDFQIEKTEIASSKNNSSDASVGNQ